MSATRMGPDDSFIWQASRRNIVVRRPQLRFHLSQWASPFAVCLTRMTACAAHGRGSWVRLVAWSSTANHTIWGQRVHRVGKRHKWLSHSCSEGELRRGNSLGGIRS